VTALTLAKAAKVAGVSRATIYRLASEGKLSVTVDGRGRKVVDPAELSRLFPKSQDETGKTDSPRHPETQARRDLEADVRVLEVELRAARELLDLTKRSLEDVRRENARLLEDKSGKRLDFNPTNYLTGGLLVIIAAVVAILALRGG